MLPYLGGDIDISILCMLIKAVGMLWRRSGKKAASLLMTGGAQLITGERKIVYHFRIQKRLSSLRKLLIAFMSIQRIEMSISPPR
jgi:hypothetical protein